MGSISQYYDKNKKLSKNLLYTKVNALKKEYYYDGEHYHLQCLKYGFSAFINIAFRLLPEQHCIYVDLYDLEGRFEREDDQYFNENEILLSSDRYNYEFSIFVPNKFCR
jgi:hypothetical protein